MLAKGLRNEHIGSAWDFSEALLALTIQYPQIWTDAYTAKKPAASNFRSFLGKGSQNGPPAFWVNISKIIRLLPESILPNNGADALSLISSLRIGITRRDEPQTNLVEAWVCYLQLFVRLLP